MRKSSLLQSMPGRPGRHQVLLGDSGACPVRCVLLIPYVSRFGSVYAFMSPISIVSVFAFSSMILPQFSTHVFSSFWSSVGACTPIIFNLFFLWVFEFCYY